MKLLQLLTLVGSISMATTMFANQQNNYQPQGQYQEKVKQQYQELTTGVEIIFSKDGSNWEKITSNGEAELIFGDRRDVRQATSKAILRAKANISKFLNEKLKTTETVEEISKTLSNSDSNGKNAITSSQRKTVETMIEKISNSSDAILKGVIVLEQNINQKEKYVSIKIGLSRKTMKSANTLSTIMDQDLASQNSSSNIEQYNSGANEIRRSKNYNNF